MNTLKLLLLTSFIALLSACGDNKEENSMSEAASEMQAATEEATDEEREEAMKRAEELEALENQ